MSGSVRCVRLEEVEGVAFLAYSSARFVLCLDGDIFPLIPAHPIGRGSRQTESYANTANGPVGGPSLSLYWKLLPRSLSDFWTSTSSLLIGELPSPDGRGGKGGDTVIQEEADRYLLSEKLCRSLPWILTCRRVSGLKDSPPQRQEKEPSIWSSDHNVPPAYVTTF